MGTLASRRFQSELYEGEVFDPLGRRRTQTCFLHNKNLYYFFFFFKRIWSNSSDSVRVERGRRREVSKSDRMTTSERERDRARQSERTVSNRLGQRKGEGDTRTGCSDAAIPGGTQLGKRKVRRLRNDSQEEMVPFFLFLRLSLCE